MADRREADVAVIGAGPAGLAAAVHAAQAGASVVVVDQSAHLGGQIWRNQESTQLPDRGRDWLARFRACGAEYLPNTAVATAEPGVLSLVGPRGPIELRARAVVLATGARELFLPFPGWTLPNVFGVGGLQALIKSGLGVHGKRVVIAGTGPLLFPVAATVAASGAELLAVCEQADRRRLVAFAASLWRSPAKLAAAVSYRSAFRGTPLRTGTWIERAEGGDRLERVTMTDGRRRWTLDCDILATACGLIPNVEVGLSMGCDVVGGALVVDGGQRTSVAGVYAAGECTGVAGEDAALTEGAIAGAVAAGGGSGASRSTWSGRPCIRATHERGVRAPTRVERARRRDDGDLPLRRRAARRSPAGVGSPSGQAGDACRNGSLPGARVRRRAPADVRLAGTAGAFAARAGARRRPRRWSEHRVLTPRAPGKSHECHRRAVARRPARSVAFATLILMRFHRFL